MSGVRLQHVGFTFPPGRDDAIRAFYGGTLGIPEMPVPPEVSDKGWIWFATRDDGIELHFIPAEAAPDTSRRHHFCLQVGDMEATRARLEADGAPLIDAGTRIIGRERLFTRDPVGNLLELVEFTDLR